MEKTETTTRGPATLIWGGRLLDLHDRLWAARGIQVVRPGGAPVARGGPSLYALLGPTTVADFSLAQVLKQFHWMKPRAVRLRIVDQTDSKYREVVTEDADHRLRGIRREYTQQTSATGRAWLTPDPNLAESWHAQRSGGEALAQLRRLSHRRESVPLRVPGVVASYHDSAGVDRWLLAVSVRGIAVDTVFDDLYQYQRGVWVHHSAELGPDVRFLGPVFVGAGRELPAGSIVIGPGIMPDDPRVGHPAQPEIRWERLRSSDWHLTALRGVRADLARTAKRIFDIVFSAAVLLATLPIYPVAMLLIYLEDGRPFFFAHYRQTVGGRDFPCYKLRTMCRDAERMKAGLQKSNQADGPQFFIENDPRLLRVGRILRKFQIDELPQFWNVLVGHMSVVGPRPSPDRENQYCPAWREARLSVRPGVTGLWQVRRTREPLTDFQEWIRYDLEYVRHYSFRRDMQIIFETVRQLVARRSPRGTP
jgi:lipopolysaccharide/colanic/teichoic acid biosynthesis glycosyltransferase